MAHEESRKDDTADAGEGTLTLTPEELEEVCRQRVCPDCPEMVKARDEVLRAYADTENIRKRLSREKDEACKFAAEAVLGDLLPVLDNLDLALEHGQRLEACKDVILGVDMTRKIFMDVLRRHELEPVGEPGQEFSPETHEAVGFASSDIHPEGLVCQVLQKGYRLKGRLLRPAKVLVSKTC